MHQHIRSLIEKYPSLASCELDIAAAFERMKQAYLQGGKLLLCGNGGSAADCDHIVGELMKGFMLKRPLSEDMREKLRQAGDESGQIADQLQGALPAISLVGQSALMTAFANDVAADMMFAQQVYGYGKPGDVLVAISTSGSSANVVKAIQVANAIEVTTIGLTGHSGGQLKKLCDIAICVPEASTPHIQELHLPIYHTLCMMLEEAFFGDSSVDRH